MATTDEQIEQLDEVIGSGEKSSGKGDRRIEYQDIDEMLKAKSTLEARNRTPTRRAMAHTISQRTGL